VPRSPDGNGSGLGLGLAGVAVVTLADAFAPGSGAPGWAYLLPFAGMLCLVAATFLERRSRTSMPALRALAIHCLTSGVIFTVLAVAAGEVVPPATPGFWIALARLIVLPTFGGYGLYWLLLRRLGVTAVNTLMFLVPPVTALWGAALFGEPLTPLTIFGFAVALAAPPW
jgi:drug/metabolite transporter (DMT)-like permease